MPHASLPLEAKKLIVVRHPLPRLVSAYVNKYLETQEAGFLQSIQLFLLKARKRNQVLLFLDNTDTGRIFEHTKAESLQCTRFPVMILECVPT